VLAWQYTRAAVALPIIGATKPHQIEAAVAALDIALEADEVAAPEAPYRARFPTGMGTNGPAMDQVSLR
jgi:aryl-alcohol dehydrogenase-like predicted oxidoreductase